VSTNDVRFIVRVAASYLSLQSSEIHNSTQATHRAQFQRSLLWMEYLNKGWNLQEVVAKVVAIYQF